jgi:uncharacterized radical SAM superfamily Fe-S cluster-containing enzyme
MTPKGTEMERGTVTNIIRTMIEKEAYIALGNVGANILFISYSHSNNSYYISVIRWYVPYSVKYPG